MTHCYRLTIAYRLTLAALLATGIGGCTQLYVKKFDPSNEKMQVSTKGIRYALPKPGVSIDIKDDNTVEIAEVSLPDESNTYAIEAKSFFSDHTLAVTRDKGLVTQVDLTFDSTGVPGAAVGAGTDVAKGVLEKQATEKAAAQGKIDEAQKAVDDAEEAVKLAEFHLANASDDAAKKTAEQELKEAKFKLDRARERLKKAQSRSGGGARAGRAAAPAKPVYFRVMEDSATVRLVPVPLPPPARQ